MGESDEKDESTGDCFHVAKTIAIVINVVEIFLKWRVQQKHSS